VSDITALRGLRLERLRAQRLAPSDAAAAPVEIVRHMIGLQAQVPSAAALAVRVRTSGLRAGDVQRDAAPGGPLVRTWLMRGTLHLAAADDLGWLLGILAPAVLRASRRRYAELGLDSGTLARAIDVLGRPLEQSPASRAELFAELAARGIDPAGQRGIHLVRHAALNGVLVCGPDQGHEQTWIRREAPATQLVDDREEALAILARRYHSAYGPAGSRDLAAWSGLPITEAQRAWRLAGDLPGEANGPRGGPSTVRLLPHFDPYLLGYAGRDHAVPPRHRRRVWTGGGYVLPTVVRDGQAVATWKSEVRGRRLAVTVTPFTDDPVQGTIAAGVDAEVADLGRFLDREATWSIGRVEPGRQSGGDAGH
jgi:hypothetical protein